MEEERERLRQQVADLEEDLKVKDNDIDFYTRKMQEEGINPHAFHQESK